ncbi:MAG TPA: hypothetical protein VF546_23940 [Pyrinomonadaceae bacterium]|jgi:hypothetical protein
MAKADSNGGAERPPVLARDAGGRVAPGALADVIEWFLDHDPRVNVVRHPRVEELFQWKQAQSRAAGEGVYEFDNAEARLAVGIVQAVVSNDGERELHAWIAQLLNALDEAAQTNEELAHTYQLDAGAASVVAEAAKLPHERGREVYLTCCWLETLCTAEVRVLGWVYQELYGRAFHPNNFAAG